MRALTFEERSSVVAGTLMDPEPNRALLTKLRTLAKVHPDTDSELADALVLALAGGGEPAPPFAECARTACRKGNLDWQSVYQSAALLVDQLASSAGSPSGNDGWIRFEFWEGPELSLGDCCRQMLERLLRRGTPQQLEQEQEATPGPGSSPPQAKLKAAREDSPTGPLNSMRAEVSPQGRSTGPRVAQRLRTRATLTRAGEVPQTAALKVSNAPSRVSSALRAIPLSSALMGASPNAPGEIAPTQAADPRADRSAVSRSAEQTADWVGKSSASVEPYPRVRDTLPSGVQVPPSNRASVQTTSAAPSRTATPIPGKPRLRGHRLRDLHVRNAEAFQPAIGELPSPSASPAGMSASTSSDDAMTIMPRRAVSPERDWIHEIAAALADECDLRGLDA